MTTVSVTIIGSGDAFGSGGRLNTCFLVRTSSHTFLIDCGATSLVGLKQHGVGPDIIDSVFISHFHGDHFGGLAFILLEMAVTGRSRPLTIVSPPGGAQKVERLLHVLYPGSSVLEKLNLSFIEYQAGVEIQIQDTAMTALEVAHSEFTRCHGLRFGVGDVVLSYSGDTEWTDALLALADQADLFICECNFYQQQIRGHLNYLSLTEHLPQLKPKRMLLTHFDSEMLQNRDKVEIEMAFDGMQISL